MSDSAADSHGNSVSINEISQPSSSRSQIPIEIISEEEMALIEAAFTAAITSRFAASYSSIPSSVSSAGQLQGRARWSIQSISTHLPTRLINTSVDQDVEDLGNMRRRTQQKRKKMPNSLLHRFRRFRGLAVTDLTSTEWCEKQMEFKLLLGSTPATEAMRVGRDRHLILEKEVVNKVKFRPMSVEDSWAKKLINSIICANQLLSDGLTRELHLISMVSGVWMVGIIDEIQVFGEESQRRSMLVDTKTRIRKRLPSEEQTRNGMFQLMCYKYLWDKSVAANGFPSKEFFEFFSLNPHHLLPEEIRNVTVEHGFPSETLADIVRHYQKTCSTLPLAEEMLLLRYELQRDRSVIGEVRFEYDHKWVGEQIQVCLEFWSGKREANVVPENERWKCRICQFASVCTAQPHPIVDSSTSQEPVEK